MSKKILVFLLTFCLVASMVPAMILAGDGGVNLPIDPLDDQGVIVGDLDKNGQVNSDDAIRLLMYTQFSEDPTYNIDQAVDYTRDGQVNSDDAIHLLMHTMFPDDETYKLDPLVPQEKNEIELPSIRIR